MPERQLIRLVVSLRLWIILGVVAISAAAAWWARSVTFDSSIDSWFLQGDQDLVTYQRFLERFDADEITVIGVFADDLFTPDRLSRLKAMTERAQGAPWVSRVLSMTNHRALVDDGGMLVVGPLMAEAPATAEAAAALRARVLADPLVAGNLVTPAGDGAAIIVVLDPAGNSFDAKTEQVEALRAIAAELQGDMTVHLVGSPPLDEAVLQRTARDYALLAPVMAGVILVTLTLLFRSLSPTVLGLGVVALADLWILGLMGLLDLSINVLTSPLAAMILAVGVAQAVHILNAYYRRVARGAEPQQAAITCTARLFTPMLFTTATTAAGFLSLRVSELKPVSDLGLLSAAGVCFAFILTVVLLPILLPLTRHPDPSFVERQQRGLFTGAAMRVGRMSMPAARGILWISALVVVASVLLADRIEVGANVMNYFLPHDPFRVEQEEVDRRLGGSAQLEFLVEAPDQGLKDPEVLGVMMELQGWLQTLPGVHSSLSAATLLSHLNQALSGSDAPALPDSRELASQLYLLLEGEPDLDALVQEDYSVGRISARGRISDAKRLTRRLREIDDRVAELSQAEGLKISFTGYWKLVSDMEIYLVSSQINSFLVAFAAITVMMFLLLRSVRLGLFAMIPNLLPLAGGLLLMSLVGISLDPGTTMIGCIALGLVVDDTVHMMVHLRRHVMEGDSLESALEASLEEVGPAVVITSVVLALGFSVLGLGSFTPNRNFGLVSAMVVLMALISDLVVLPAALKVFRPRLGAPAGEGVAAEADGFPEDAYHLPDDGGL